jgi:hypothetical protein
MNIIELNNCFVQPQAILAISASRYFNMEVAMKATDPLQDFYEPSIKVTLVGDEKREWTFENEQARDERLAAIVEQMRKA